MARADGGNGVADSHDSGERELVARRREIGIHDGRAVLRGHVPQLEQMAAQASALVAIENSPFREAPVGLRWRAVFRSMGVRHG